MRKTIILYCLLLILFACNHIDKDQPKATKPKNSVQAISLGEDKSDINCFVKNIYEVDHTILIDLDFVEIAYKNVDERVIVNKNPKIRTYKIDSTTLIYSKDCKTLNANELLAIKNEMLKDSSIIAVGNSGGGKMIDINFGCYN